QLETASGAFRLFILLLLAPAGQAQIAGPGWIHATADPVNLQEANEYYLKRPAQLRIANTNLAAKDATASASDFSSATTETPEIAELARGLKNDPKLIYEYVHNHVDYVPYF